MFLFQIQLIYLILLFIFNSFILFNLLNNYNFFNLESSNYYFNYFNCLLYQITFIVLFHKNFLYFLNKKKNCWHNIIINKFTFNFRILHYHKYLIFYFYHMYFKLNYFNFLYYIIILIYDKI